MKFSNSSNSLTLFGELSHTRTHGKISENSLNCSNCSKRSELAASNSASVAVHLTDDPYRGTLEVVGFLRGQATYAGRGLRHLARRVHAGTAG